MQTQDGGQVLQKILLAGSIQNSIDIISRHYLIDYVTLHMISSRKSTLDSPFVRTNYPAQWVSHYLLNNYVRVDPILREALTVTAPFCWSSIKPSAAEQKILIKAKEFGIGTNGYSIPHTDKLGGKSVLSLNSTLELEDWKRFLEENASNLMDLSKDMHVQAVAEAFAEQSITQQLSPREFECLRWTSEGKTYSEIAIILDLSEHTIRSYLKVARLKLDSVSLAQAVAKASRIGMF